MHHPFGNPIRRLASHLCRGGKPVRRITNVTRPTIGVYKPPKDTDTGAAVLICPGGGYNILAWDLEGEEVAAWLNSIGVTGPRPSEHAASTWPQRCEAWMRSMGWLEKR